MPRSKGALRPGTSALKPSKASALKLHGPQAGEGSRVELDEYDWGRARTLVKPDDQLDLKEDELKEEIARVLTVRTPQQSEGLVIWSHKDAAFVQRAVPTAGALLLDMPSTCLHIDSQEAREQVAYLGAAGRITLAETLTMAAKSAPKSFKKESRRSGGGEDDEEEEEAW